MLARNKVNQHQRALECIPPTIRRHRRILGIISTLLLIILIFAAVRLPAVANILSVEPVSSNDELLVHIGNQQAVTLDLRQSLPNSPDPLGANVFPQSGTSSEDNAQGFMDYSPPFTGGLTDAHIKLLRFPGSKWGEDHSLSLDQLSAFSTLLVELNADGMVQVRLSGSFKGACRGCGLSLPTDVVSRAAVAGRWVDFLNNPRSDQRIGRYAHVPYHPVKYWTVGDEPDTLINPATGQKYLVRDYVNDFIQFSMVMHKMDPGIKVFGPDISQFYGPGGGPTDPTGQPWMEGFLQAVGAFERAHNVVLLDGVSFHHYPFINATQVTHPQDRDPVSVYATQDNTHQTVSLLLINKSNTSQLAQISGGNNQFGISSCAVECGFSQQVLDVSLAGYSMVVVTLHHTGNAEAYSFIAPVGAVACPCPAVPVIHTLCGKKVDPLATTIPC